MTPHFQADWNGVINAPRMQNIRRRRYIGRATGLLNPRRVVPAIVAGDVTMLSPSEARALGISEKDIRAHQKWLAHDGTVHDDVAQAWKVVESM